MFLLCRKALRNVELLKDLDWSLVQIMYFAKIVGFALEWKLLVGVRTSLKSIRFQYWSYVFVCSWNHAYES